MRHVCGFLAMFIGKMITNNWIPFGTARVGTLDGNREREREKERERERERSGLWWFPMIFRHTKMEFQPSNNIHDVWVKS